MIGRLVGILLYGRWRSGMGGKVVRLKGRVTANASGLVEISLHAILMIGVGGKAYGIVECTWRT